jgi:hypothetical protein
VTVDVDVSEKSAAAVVRLELLVEVLLVVLDAELTVKAAEAESSLGLLMTVTA